MVKLDGRFWKNPSRGTWVSKRIVAVVALFFIAGAALFFYIPSVPKVTYKKLASGGLYQVKLYFDSQEELLSHVYLACEISGGKGDEPTAVGKMNMIATTTNKVSGKHSYVADLSFDAMGGSFSKVVSKENLLRQLGGKSFMPCGLVEMSCFGANPESEPMQIPVKDLLATVQF